MNLVQTIKQSARDLIRRAGFDVIRLERPGQEHLGRDPFLDMSLMLKGVKKPVIFDVGANVGQSVESFRQAFPGSIIHSFEPSPTTYAKLRARCEGMRDVSTWNYAAGADRATLPFTENTKPDMSSFLAPGELCWGSVEKVTPVQVVTLDSFAEEQGIEFIHVLKSDTQGYDFEVFKGAERLMNENKIGLIYFEFIFSDMYKNLPAFHEVFRYLQEHHFSLVSFYESHFQQDLVSWTDVMFINRTYNQQRMRNHAG